MDQFSLPVFVAFIRIQRQGRAVMKPTYQRFFETLERRRLLASSPMSSQFQSNIVHTVTDGHGFHSNWIEVSNPSNESINLPDWHLTDSSEELTKWSFPTVELAPGEALVLFV